MVGLIILVIIVALLAMPFTSYNSMQRMSQTVRRGNANIMATMQKYTETINALQNVVVGFADHEKVMNLHISDNLTEMTAQANQALNNITSMAQNYPEIKSDKTYVNLMNQISDIQTELQQARFSYNAAVDEYNTKRTTFPHLIFAGIFHFPEAPYYNPENVSALNEFRTDDGEYLRQTLYKVGQSAISTTARAGNKIASIGQRRDPEMIGMDENYDPAYQEDAAAMNAAGGMYTQAGGSFCPSCGQALPPGVAFCVHCGTKLQA